jgi:hypothetical protein
MGGQSRHFMNESDIGSGDKTAADHETQQLIEQIGHDGKNPTSQKYEKRQRESGNEQQNHHHQHTKNQ